MPSMFENTIRRKLENLGNQWTEADITTAVLCSINLSTLELRKAAGENVEQEIAHAKMQVHAIAAGTAVGAASIVRDTIISVLAATAKAIVL